MPSASASPAPAQPSQEDAAESAEPESPAAPSRSAAAPARPRLTLAPEEDFDDEDEEDGLNEDDVISRMQDLDKTMIDLQSRIDEIIAKKEREREALKEVVSTPELTPEPESEPEQVQDDERMTLATASETKEELIQTTQNQADVKMEDALPPPVDRRSREAVIPKLVTEEPLKYLANPPLKLLTEYRFYAPNIRSFNKLRPTITSVIQGKRKREHELGRQLQQEYKVLYDAWIASCRALDAEIAAASSSSKGKSRDSSSAAGQPSSEPAHDEEDEESGVFRRARRSVGDAVRSEAEFMEVLASLEREEQLDPKNRAKLTSARIPNMILDEHDRKRLYVDTNNIVKDPNIPLERLVVDGVDVFTEEEHRLFCEGYKLHPKQFGFIARHMGYTRTFEECVLHYYRTKKEVDYKSMAIAGRRRGPGGRKGRRKTRGGAQSAGTSAPRAAKPRKQPLLDGPTVDNSGNRTGDSTPAEEVAEVAPSSSSHARQSSNRMPDEEIAALLELGSSGRPRRAAAPVFGEKKDGGFEQQQQQQQQQLQLQQQQQQTKTKRGRGGKKGVVGKGRGAVMQNQGEEYSSVPAMSQQGPGYDQYAQQQMLLQQQQPIYQYPPPAIQQPVPPQQPQQQPQQGYQQPQPVDQISRDLKDREVDAISALAGLFGGIDGFPPAEGAAAQQPSAPQPQPQLQQPQQPPDEADQRAEIEMAATAAQAVEQQRIYEQQQRAYEQQQHREQVIKKPDGEMVMMIDGTLRPAVSPYGVQQQQQQPHQPSTSPQLQHTQVSAGGTTITTTQQSSGSGSSKRNNLISSYWSVHEMDLFPKLLQSYGTQWEEVSKHLKAKTTTMVKNYYARNAEKFGWDRVTHEANMLISRGQPTPAPPSQPVPVRKRYEAQQRIQGGDEEEDSGSSSTIARAGDGASEERQGKKMEQHQQSATAPSSTASSSQVSPKPEPGLVARPFEAVPAQAPAPAAPAPAPAPAQRGPRLGFFMDTVVNNPVVAPVTQAAASVAPPASAAAPVHDSRMGLASIMSRSSGPTSEAPAPAPAPAPARAPPKMSNIANLLNDDEPPEIRTPSSNAPRPQAMPEISQAPAQSAAAPVQPGQWSSLAPSSVLHHNPSPPAPPPQLPGLQPGYAGQPSHSLFPPQYPGAKGVVTPAPPPPPQSLFGGGQDVSAPPPPMFPQANPMLPNPFFQSRPPHPPGFFQPGPPPQQQQQQQQGQQPQQGQSPRLSSLINGGNLFELPTPFSSRESNERGV
ncbi:hypothetical protein BZA70DRAFT_292046 [Myxozyma melibiosi]|uniref:SANT domain-containing protein n=1 Tax=Myxozyma melibiosi TaxID=54550 RepID=A0ABR1EYF3_9ASCO